MTIRKIARMGHPVLAGVAEPVENPRDPEIQRLIADMFETMDDARGAGISAPQVHESLRVVVFSVGGERMTDDDEDTPLSHQVLINPEIEPLGNEVEVGWEGCLSVPGMIGAVPRHRRIRYSGLDETGATVERTVSGFHARVVQHECDHLDGILYPMRMPDMSRFGFVEEMSRAADAESADELQEAAE